MQPRDPAAMQLLLNGRIEIKGRLVDASNATLFCAISLDGVEAECVYKPVRGERPLWDFPDGTLAGREVASYLISDASGWGLIPPTILRPGPFGPGMVQLWVDTKDDGELVDIVPVGAIPEGWREVLRAHDQYGDPSVLIHADRPSLRQLAVLDIVVNNADRKGGHVLLGTDDNVYAVDHGICLHSENKLRTVLWGWLGEALPEDVVAVLDRLAVRLDADLGERLAEHLTITEVRAVRDRVTELLAEKEFPAPSGDWPAIPWPAF